MIFVEMRDAHGVTGFVALEHRPINPDRPWRIEAQGEPGLRYARTLNEARRVLTEHAPPGKQRTIARLGGSGQRLLEKRRTA